MKDFFKVTGCVAEKGQNGKPDRFRVYAETQEQLEGGGGYRTVPLNPVPTSAVEVSLGDRFLVIAEGSFVTKEGQSRTFSKIESVDDAQELARLKERLERMSKVLSKGG